MIEKKNTVNIFIKKQKEGTAEKNVHKLEWTGCESWTGGRNESIEKKKKG